MTIWTILGTARWTLRLPVGFVLGAVFILPLIRFRYWGENAAALFAAQLLALAGICITLRWQGFRLMVPAAAIGRSSSAPQLTDLQTSQFGLRHVLIWTTALSLICGLVRAIGLPLEQWAEVRYRSWVIFISGGAAVAIVLVIALWEPWE